jgi:Protein of unknown function (DUF732)
MGLVLGACGGGGGGAAVQKNQIFLSDVHVAAPDIGSYRTNVQLTRLAQAACDDFGSGASYEEIADRLALSEGSHPLPSEDLGAVIDAAVQAYCPQFSTKVGAG